MMALSLLTRDWVCMRYERTTYDGVKARMFYTAAEAIAALALGEGKLFAVKVLQVATTGVFLATVKATIPADPPAEVRT